MSKNNSLRSKWERYCRSMIQKYHNKSCKLKKDSLQLERQIRRSLSRHEYLDAEMKEEQLQIIQKHLEECLPMSLKKYLLKAFEKEFKSITRGYILDEQHRLFFRIYYYREYEGMMAKDIQSVLQIDHNRYYRVYAAGIKMFFLDNQEEQTKVG